MKRLETLSVVMVGSGMIPIPPPGYGAVEKHIWHLSRALEARGHEIRLLSEVVGPGGMDEYRFALMARRRVRGMAYDVLHLHTTGVAFTFHLLGPGGYVYTSHSRHWTLRRGLNERLGFALEKVAVAGAKRVIALSDRMFHQMGCPAKAEVVPNGVDTDLYRPDYDAREGNRVVAVGRVEPHKGFHLASRALEGLGATLTIVGPVPAGRYGEGLRALPWVNLIGEVEEEVLVHHLATSDVYIHPSSSEAFSLAVVEAMAAGLPIVGTEACASQVEEGGNGYVVSGGTEVERTRNLRDRLSALLSDPSMRQSMARRSRALAEERYRWSLIAGQVEDVYRRAVDRGGTQGE